MAKSKMGNDKMKREKKEDKMAKEKKMPANVKKDQDRKDFMAKKGKY